jgi:hypothetical protein
VKLKPTCDGSGDGVKLELVEVPEMESLQLGEEAKLVVLTSHLGKGAFRARLSSNAERFVPLRSLSDAPST